jgi:branched-chain amino acid transport system permease protein
MNYFLHLLVFFEIYVIVALSLNLLIGYSGLLQIAHAAYFGVGAYAGSLIMLKFGFGFIPAMIFGGLISALLSLLVSLPAWRFRGDYFVMISLAVQVTLYSIMYNWVELTNGPYGLTGIPQPAIFSSIFATTGSIAVLYGAIVAILAGILGILKLSPFGRSLQAMRDDELAARSIGLPVRKLKVESFLIASAMVGIAGCMYSSYVRYIDPSSFTLDESILMLSMVIVGGTGNIRGPLLGAGVLIALPELLRFMAMPDSVAANVRLLAYGLLLIVMMHVRPQGLAGKYRFE